MDEGLVINGEKREEAEFKRSVSKQVILGLLTNFSSIAPSMSLGFSAVALPPLKNTLNADQLRWFASIASLATPFGCFFSGPIADRFGRKTAMFCVNIICFIGWMTIAAAYYSQNGQYPLLLLGRILTGLSTGLSSAPATIYMAEVSSSKLRGVFTTWGSISFSLGILAVYMLGFIMKDSWGTISLITATLPCIGILLIEFLVPESPTWLVGKNRLEEARASLLTIFSTNTYSTEVQTAMETLVRLKGVKNNTEKKTILVQVARKIKYLLKPHCLKPFGLVMAYFFFQQFAGTFVIVFYAIDIVKKAGITVDPYLTIVVIGLIRLLTAVVVSYVSKRCGRRPLSILSGSGMTVCMLALACYIWLQSLHKIPPEVYRNLTFLPLVLLLLYFFTSTLGFLPMPFALSAEVFPTKIRGTATGLLSGCGYLFNFITVNTYPNMADRLGREGVFFFYGIVALLGTVFVIFLLPETKGKSLEEIREYFGERKEGDKKKMKEEEEEEMMV